MALEMKPSCERCAAPLSHGARALICSYECTFCDACAHALSHVCPNCGGELCLRPRRGDVAAPRVIGRHTASTRWERGDASFVDGRYSRAHTWSFDGGTVVPASSSPHVVPRPMSIDAAVDPEEAFVASLSSCHMLWFLSLAAKAGFVVDAYDDAPEGVMTRTETGFTALTTVSLRPVVTFQPGAPVPTADELASLHERAHRACFIACSVRSDVRVVAR